MPLDVYIYAPEPGELAGVLSEELRSNTVHAFPVYWNVLAWAFTQVIAGKMDAAHLDYFHNDTLDAHGSTFLPEQI